MADPRVVVVGQLARDLVLVVDGMPDVGSAGDVRERREVLGGKGANQAVALAQLGASVALVAVWGTDGTGDALVAQAERDGIDVTHVVRRPDTPTGLIVEVLDGDGRWRYLQHLPDAVLVTEDDIAAAAGAITAAGAVLIQLQQPAAAALAAARLAHDAGRLVVLDGVPDEHHRDALLALADVVRTDAHETELLAGTKDPDKLLNRTDADLSVYGVDDGNLFVWNGSRWGSGHVLLPLTDDPVVDTTGGGDALVAALTVALMRGDPPERAARYAVAASGAAVTHVGGRPHLSDGGLRARTAP